MKQKLILLLLFWGLFAGAQEGAWDDWQKTSCYNKIAYRIKEEPKHGEQFHWKIQFKSEYSELISFNYHVTDKLQEYNITTHRKTLKSNELSGEIDVYTKEDDIFLLVDKVSLSPYPEKFIDCDN